MANTEMSPVEMQHITMGIECYGWIEFHMSFCCVIKKDNPNHI